MFGLFISVHLISLPHHFLHEMSCLRKLIFKPSVLGILRTSSDVKSQTSFRHVCDRAFSSSSSSCNDEKAGIHSLGREKASDNYDHDRLNISSTLLLNDNFQIPRFGLGVYDIDPIETKQAVLWALESGYRQIDTAARYNNEKCVGQAIKESQLNREELFVVTKVYRSDHGHNETLKAFEKSLNLLGLDYVDLYLIHFPVPGSVVQTWKAMIKLKEMGLIRSIGVSNFNIHHLEALRQASPVTPSVNQIEVHPYLQERSLVEYCKERGIAVQAYSPLTRGKKLDDPILKVISKEYSRSPAQVLLRWCIQKGFICIPKSFHYDRIKENTEIFEFEIEQSHMDILDGLEEGFRTGRDRILWPWDG